MAHSLTKITVIALAAIILVAAVYSALTFPTDLVEMQVSFAIGADQEREAFDLPIMHDRLQVEVTISSGSALWSASITDVNESKVWEHTKAQADQTSYTSGWITFRGGSYNFTFGAIGYGQLEANVKVASKGGFW